MSKRHSPRERGRPVHRPQKTIGNLQTMNVAFEKKAAGGRDVRAPMAPPLQQIDRTYVLYRGKKYSYFGGCDYFRLASHPQIIAAMREGMERFGLNVAASRLTTGNHRLYQELEQRLAEFFDVECAVLLSNGYMTNLAVAQALAGSFSHVLVDEHAHASLQDAAQYFQSPILTFKHRDFQDAERALKRCGRRPKPVLLTDGMFSRDGEIAPLQDYLRLLPADGLIVVDDAHGAGTLGTTGKGTVEHLHMPTKQIVQTITLSKAFGVYGGAILGSQALRKKILCRSRIFVGNTPLPLPLAYAASQALKLVRDDKGLRKRLATNTHYVKGKLRAEAFPVTETPSPIVSFIPRNVTEAAFFKRHFLAHGIFHSLISYPGGPRGGYFRFTLSSEHSREQLDSLLDALLSFKP